MAYKKRKCSFVAITFIRGLGLLKHVVVSVDVNSNVIKIMMLIPYVVIIVAYR
jgi:hypothetical protein